MKTIYHDILSADVARWIVGMSYDYSYVVEVSLQHFDWTKFNEWIHKNLDVHQISSEGCMGEPTTRKTHLYGLISKDPFTKNSDKFFFFKTKREKDQFVEDFADDIIDTKPFKTELDYHNGGRIWPLN